jgi:hypothetical protein
MSHFMGGCIHVRVSGCKVATLRANLACHMIHLRECVGAHA